MMSASEQSTSIRSLRWTAVDSEIGVILGALSQVGVAAVLVGRSVDELADQLALDAPGTRLTRDSGGDLEQMAGALAELAAGRSAELSLSLDLGGTHFQRRVWASLQRIPRGETRTYAQVAEDIGHPTAFRAVANACGANPTALVIPCHRVVRSDGSLGGYRWGVDVKASLLRLETY